jgi:hypothetical protein
MKAVKQANTYPPGRAVPTLPPVLKGIVEKPKDPAAANYPDIKQPRKLSTRSGKSR